MRALHRVFPLLLLAGAAGAQEDPWYGDVPPAPWGDQEQEEAVVVPPFPDDRALLPLDTQFRDYRYFIDPRSLSIADHRTVRYTVVIDSANGVRNVLYEGIACGPRQVKTYAHATGQGPFHESKAPDWATIRGGTAFVYRRDLQEFYLCDGLTPRRSVDEIIARIERRAR